MRATSSATTRAPRLPRGRVADAGAEWSLSRHANGERIRHGPAARLHHARSLHRHLSGGALASLISLGADIVHFGTRGLPSRPSSALHRHVSAFRTSGRSVGAMIAPASWRGHRAGVLPRLTRGGAATRGGMGHYCDRGMRFRTCLPHLGAGPLLPVSSKCRSSRQHRPAEGSSHSERVV